MVILTITMFLTYIPKSNSVIVDQKRNVYGGIMSAQYQYTLMVECFGLQKELKSKTPEHYLNLFDTRGKSPKDWERITERFYTKFSGTERPWRKLTQADATKAWENFRIYLLYALGRH